MEIDFAVGGLGLEVGGYAAEAEAWLLVCYCGEGAADEGEEGGACEGQWEGAEGGCEGGEGALRGSEEGRCHCVFRGWIKNPWKATKNRLSR